METLTTELAPVQDRPAPAWFRLSFYPLALIGAVATHLWLTRGLAPQLHALVAGGIALGFMTLCLILERLAPRRLDWNRPRGDVLADVLQTNVVLPVATQVNELAVGGLIAWLAARHLWHPVLGAWPFAGRFVVALLLAELGYYWVHRLGHTWMGLWRFHAVHHGAERVYSLNAGRFHAVDAWLSTLIYLGPLLLLGVDAPTIALLSTLNAVSGYLEHANVDFEAGWLNRVFNSAQLHRWHHATEVAIANHNYGKVLSVWDQVFRTWYLPGASEVQDVGLSPGEPVVPGGFWGQLLYPWRRS